MENVNIAVVTGGAHGIGKALCRRLSRDGAAVVVVDIDKDAAEDLAAEINGHAEVADVGVEADIESLIQRVEENVGHIDMFVSNAGVVFGDGEAGAASREGRFGNVDDRWDVCWRVNVMAHVWAARYLVPLMSNRGGGYLVNTASAAGLLAQIGDAAYTTTKHAAVGFADSLAITHADDGIKVAVVCPQAVATRLLGVDPDELDADRGAFVGAAVDGILSAEAVADAIVDGVASGKYLITPHESVHTYTARRAEDHDRWVDGMRRFRQKLLGSAGK
ncbi:MAG: SDR family oxidoreductase [Pseudomonadota bacterium]